MSENVTENSISPQSAVLGVFLGSISLITIVMNLLVLYAVKTEKKLQTVGNLYIVSLSVADLIVGAAVMPLNIFNLLSPKRTLGLPACLFWLSMDYVACTASIFNLFILCIDRYRSVQQPLKYLKYRTKMRASLMILGVWLLSFMWIIPILGWHAFANNGKRKEIGNKCETEFSDVIWFKVLTAIVNFYLPSILMLWFYYKIFRAVQKHCQHRQLINGPNQSPSEKNSHHSQTKDKLNTCLQKQILDENTPPKDKQSSPQPQNMEVELHFSNPEKTSKALVSRSNSRVFKWSCFPLPTAQSEPSLDKAGKKEIHTTKEEETEEEPCSQDSDLSDASDDHQMTFTEATGTEHSNANSARTCGPQEKTETGDSKGLSYLRKTWQSLQGHSKRHGQGLHVNRERKAAKQLGVIMTAFMLCWIPYFVLFMVTAFHGHEQFPILHTFTVWLGYVNSTLNPFLYPLCNQNFKKTFKKILRIH